MNRFKHLKPGMSLLEVIASIAILAIFGSSIFLMQQYLFDRLEMSQRKLIANLRMQEELVTYQKNILQEFFEGDGSVKKSLEEYIKNFTSPAMTIKIIAQSDLGSVADVTDTKESTFKDFKHVYLIRAQVDQDEYEYARAYVFVYVPEVIKQ